MTSHFNKISEKEKRRRLRNKATKPEKRLWQFLKGKQLGGFKFRRQYSVDSYVIDFYCPQVKLAIEIDGKNHFTPAAREYDKNREKYISAFGITFLRFLNTDIYENIDGVLQLILTKLNELKAGSPPC